MAARQGKSAVALDDLVGVAVLVAVHDREVDLTVAIVVELEQVGLAVAVGVGDPEVGLPVIVRVGDDQLDRSSPRVSTVSLSLMSYLSAKTVPCSP